MQGLGTIDSPYIVTTLAEYKSISSAPSACYKLGNDIDMSSSPGLACDTFSGTFDGNGHRITGQTGNLQSAFCRLLTGGAVVKNVGFALNINNTNGGYTGGVAAEVGGNCTIQKVWIDPAIPATMAYVQSTASLRYQTPYAGGIVGRIYNGVVLIEDCYLADYVMVTARDNSMSSPYAPARAGGAVGSYEGGSLTLRRFYKIRTVSAVGYASSGSYDQILYKAGSTAPITQDNFFNFDYFESTSPYGTGKTTAQMKTQATFTNWDFTNVWKISAGNYPTLKFAPPPLIENRTLNSKVAPIFGRTNRSVKATTKSIVQNVIGRATATLTNGAIGTRTIVSKIEPILGRVTVGNHVTVTLKSTVDPLTGKVKTTATYSIDCFVDESTSGVNVLQTVPTEKIIETAIDVINQAILPTDNRVVPKEMTKIVDVWIDGINEAILSYDGIKKIITVKSYVESIKTTAAPHYNNIIRVVTSVINSIIGKANTTKEKTERLKSYVSPINTSARRYSHSEVVIVKSIMDDIVAKVPVTWKVMATVLSKLEPVNGKADRYHSFTASRIVHSILKKIKTDIDIKIPGLGAKVKSDKIGTTDVNVERIYNQVKVETTSPNVTVKTNQGQVGTTIKYQKVIIRIGDE
jgi:hypothetical protein